MSWVFFLWYIYFIRVGIYYFLFISSSLVFLNFFFFGGGVNIPYWPVDLF